MLLDDQTNKQNQEYFTTRDLYLAAVLICYKFTVLSIDFQIEGARGLPVGYFQFKKTDELMEVVGKFWQNTLTVEPRDFINNMRGLKSQVTTVYKSPHARF